MTSQKTKTYRPAAVVELVYTTDLKGYDMYKDYKIYGPYKRNDGRQHVIAVGNDRKTISYPKYLVEISIGRYLNEDETVHHVDGNVDNNDLSNLRIIKRDEHSRLHAIIYNEHEICNCVECGKKIILNRTQQQNRRTNEKRNINGPFCSRKCSGIYGAKIQNECR